jgi:hypothetical protein
MNRDKHKTKVIFRVMPGGDVIALFQRIAHDYAGHLCESYMHIGQHGGADAKHCARIARLATAREYRDFARELRGLGYRLDIGKRTGRADALARLASV